ncbi:PAS domain S-box protein [Undibacterium sp. TJN25]|uniref:hybrid sensor histidine kinase/response regulator n=1 Tax=Undibacterium sp. TJN25 TaxID=3413056 RepID=UPI003BF336A7
MNTTALRGGEAGELIRRFDWTRTTLGAMDSWPQALRTVVDIMLNSDVAMVLMWGPEHVMLYNDNYAPIAGRRHPQALGGKVESTWPEIWDWNQRVIEAGFRGESQSYQRVNLAVERNDVSEEVWFDLFYTPVRGDGGDIGGVLCTAIEITEQIRAEQSQQLANAELNRLNRLLEDEKSVVKAANSSLSAETGLLRELFQQVPSFMAVLRGPDHVFELANKPYLQLIGNREVVGKGVEEALPEIRGQGFIDLLDRVYATGEPYVGKHAKVILKSDGDGPLRQRFVDFVYQPIRSANGEISGIFIDGLDVTERTATEERLRIAQQAGGIGSFEWFPGTGMMVVSDTYRQLFGIADGAEVTADLLTSLVHQEDRAKIGPVRFLNNENPLAYAEYRITRLDNGELRWIARQGEVIGSDTLELQRYVGVALDITERKEIEQALRASEDRLKAIFGQASVGLSELDLAGGFKRVNGALCRMLGRPEEELLRLNMNDIIHPDDMQGNALKFRRLVETGEAFTLEKRYLKPGNTYVWVSSSVSRLVDEHGQAQALIAVKTDITERRRIEEALREMNETLEQRVADEVAQRAKAEDALRQAQKMEAVGQLTGGVAHDFNNVLQIISGNLQLMRLHSGSDSIAQRRLDTAIAAVERGAKLSMHLLAFARRQPLQPVVADLGRLVRNMDELLRRALGEAIEIETVVSGGLWNVLIDPGQIENVILNLAINARDAMKGDGKLTIELGNAMLDDYYVQSVPDLPAGQYVMLSVSDTGCGMSAEIVEKAFEPFFTTKPEGEGTGLGLSMAYGFVKQSRGHIKIYSEPKQGTTIKIYLPRSLQAEVEIPGVLTGPVVGGTETILVVEDDAGVRTTVVDMLTALGYRVLKAENGESALVILKSGVPIDLLFTDVVMPGPVRSPDLARQAKEVLPDIAVLFTSGYTQNAIVHGGRLDPGVELLSKPYQREELARRLRHILANRQQKMQARLFSSGERTGVATVSSEPAASALKVLVVEDDLDSQQMVCELLGMLGHSATGLSDAEEAWELLTRGNFDILFTDVSLPGISGVELAKKVVRNKPEMRVIFSTGYGKESLDNIGFKASMLRKPYDLMQLKAALETGGE